MSAYDNDPRVVRAGGFFSILVGDREWVIQEIGGLWYAYDPHGQQCETASRKGTADEAIRAVIGDPQ